MMTANLLELRSITKCFSGTLALQDVSLQLAAGQTLAVVGENGAGKSTLMKILSGVHRPDSGSIVLAGREVQLRSPGDAQSLGISTIYQEFSLVPHLTVVENLFLGREYRNAVGASRRAPMRRSAQAVLDRLGATFAIDTSVARLSVAEQQFVEIAKALLRQSRILIMDEPTATLTGQEVQRLFQIMRELVRQRIAIIFISHHLDEVFEIADDLVCLRDGRMVGAQKANECTRESLIRMMVGRDLTLAFPKRDGDRCPRVALDVHQLQRKPHLPTNSFQVHEGEILGVAGLVGSGRTKMVRALIGADRPHRHVVSVGGKHVQIRNPAEARAAGIGLVPEDRKQQGLVLDASVQDNVCLSAVQRSCHPRWGYIQPTTANRLTRQQLDRLQVKCASTKQSVRTLSGGNQQKVVLAKWLMADCRILVLDEPTRGIDVGAKGELYRLMRELTRRGVAIILISSELPEVVGMSDRVMVMRGQRIERLFGFGEPLSEESIMNFAAGGYCENTKA